MPSATDNGGPQPPLVGHVPPDSAVRHLDPELVRALLSVGTKSRSAGRAQQLLDLVPAALCVFDAEAQLTSCNRGALELIRARPVPSSRGSVVSLVVQQLDGTGFPGGAMPVEVALREARALRDAEVRIARADGSSFPASLSVDPIPDARGRIGGAIVVIQDITARKETEERLRVRETELELIRTHAPVVLSHWDTDHRLLFATRAFAARWNTTPETLLGKTVADILGAETFAAVLPFIQRAMKGEELEFEAEIEYRELGRRFMRVAYAPDLGPDGTVRGFLTVATDMTARRRTEIALRESEERLRMATRTGKVGLWDWDVKANRVSWTQSLYELHGVTPEQFDATAEAFFALVHPEDRGPVQRAVQSTLEHGAPFELEFRAVRPAGGTVWLFTNAVLVQEAGNPVHLMGATLDITARKQAELALRESEARFRALASHAPVGILLTDTNGDCVFTNESWRSMSGLSPDEARGKGWFKSVHPDDVARVREEWYACVREQRPFATEYRFQRPDGVIFWLEGTAVEWRNANGVRSGYIGIVVDITERRAAEEALRESEKRFRTLASHAPVGIFLTTPTGDTLFVNEEWTRMVGVDTTHARGRGWMDAIHPDDRSRVVAEWENALHRGGASHAEYRFRRPDGTVAWVQGKAVQLLDETGRSMGYIGTIADVTERKLAEEKLRGQEAQLRLISTNAPIMLAHCDREQRYLFVNRAYAARHGVEPPAIIGRTIRDVLGPAAHEAFAPFIARVLAGESVEHELEVPFAALGPRFIRISYVPDVAADGTVRGWLSATSDITEQRRSDDALRRLAAIVESSDDAILSKDLDGIVTSWNEGAERVFGYPAAEAIGRPIVFLLPPGREGEERVILDRIRRAERIDHFETVRQRKDGTLIEMSLTVSPLKDATGRVVGASTIARDITRRNRDAAELRRHVTSLEVLHRVGTTLAAERELQRIVQSVTDAGREVSGAAFGAFFYRVKDEAGELHVRQAWSGVPREAFAHFTLPHADEFFALGGRTAAVVRIADVPAEPDRATGLPPQALVEGQWLVRSYLALSVTSRSGEVLGRLLFGHPQPGVFTDDTERTVRGIAAQAAIAIDNARLYEALSRELREKSKAEAELRNAQAQLQAHASELEQKVQQRTASLREAIAQMEEFSYSVSHDLRAPLRAMNAYAQALVEDYGPQLDETARNYLERIQRSSRRMEKLTHDVLTYSRVARAEVRLLPVDLEVILRDLVVQYAELQSAATDLDIVRPLHRVLAHESSLGQCLANLLTNAVKFVNPGTRPRIRVRTERAGERVRIWIEDNGIGIAPQYQAALFHVFERVPTRQNYEGTGIGLAIVRKATEKMSGRCGVESDGVTGSRFWIELPASA